MIIIGCDFHTRYQQIAMAEDTTSELLLERRSDHESGRVPRGPALHPGPLTFRPFPYPTLTYSERQSKQTRRYPTASKPLTSNA